MTTTKSAKLQLYIEPSLKKQIEDAAYRKRKGLSEYVRDVLRERVEAEEREVEER